MAVLRAYYIEDGVHRAAAARAAGLARIPAILYVPGQPPRKVYPMLDELYSPRPSVSRSDPRHNFLGLVLALQTVQGRRAMPPISIQPLGVPGQSATTPLAQVVIVA